ncbi:MAG TPA: acido-empty-quinoprotein group A [Bryobacteraceae bacterium]|nr:acido-empty-quinoprotein group A [Bryobacteraceae bacterium]
MRAAIFLWPLAAAVAFAQAGPLDNQLLLKTPAKEWAGYHGDSTGRHYSALNQITRENVHELSLAWVSRVSTANQDAVFGGDGPDPAPTPPGAAAPPVRAIPLVVNGVIYYSASGNAFALDARTGKRLWHFAYKTGGGGSRGLAMYGDWLFMTTGEPGLVSLDAATGKERWHKRIAPGGLGYSSSVAPIVVGNHIIIGTGGDRSDHDAWVESRDPETGDIQWRWNSTPRKGDAALATWPSEDAAIHGGGGVWQMPTYDPELGLLYVTTGQPNPVFDGTSRPGDNLYTSSIVALHADTGKMAWYFQTSPHDTHDWDATEVPVLIDGTIDGRPRKLLAQANRNGYYFLLDRTNGKDLVTKPFIHANWAKGINEKGQPIADPAQEPIIGGSLVTPTSDGAANFPAPSFSPDTGLLYVNTVEGYSVFHLEDPALKPVGFAHSSEYAFGAGQSALKAIDYRTGAIRWEHDYPGGGFGFGSWPGVLSTAGHVVFAGDDTTNLVAYNADTGKILWHADLGGVVGNSPITYQVDGVQYVLVSAGDSIWAFWLQ